MGLPNASMFAVAAFGTDARSRSTFIDGFWDAPTISTKFVDGAIGTSKLTDGASFIKSDGSVAMLAALNLGSHLVHNVLDPVSAQDGATKNYVDGAVAAISGYVKANGTVPFTADQSMGSHRLTNVLDPVAAQDVATKNYVDSTVATDLTGLIHADGSVVFTANQSLGSHKLTNVLDPVAAQDAATKNYVDNATAVIPNLIHADGSVPWTANQSVGNHRLTNVLDPGSAQDAATKNYVDVTLSTLIHANGSIAFTAAQSHGGFGITNVLDPMNPQDAATKNYVDSQLGTDLTLLIHKDGSVAWTADQSVGGHKLTNLATPVAGTDATNRTYVDGAIAAIDYTPFTRRDGSVAFTGTQSLGGFKLTNVLDPVGAQDAATKNYVDNHIGTAGALATTGAPVVITGAAPPTVGQVLTSLTATTANWQTPTGGGGGGTLDAAYDFGGAGSGRIVIADAGAFEVQQSSIKIQGVTSNGVATLPWVLQGSTGGAVVAAVANPASFAATSAVVGTLPAGSYTVGYTWTNANGESLLSPIVGVANPTFTPTWEVGGGGGSLTAGLFHAVFTATNAAGETLASPVLTINNSGGLYSSVGINFLPGLAGATGYKLYFSDAANSNTLRFAGSVVSAGTVVTVNAYPVGATPPLANTTAPCTIAVNGSQAVQVAALTPLPAGVTGVNYYLTTTNGSRVFLVASGNGTAIVLNTVPTAPFTIQPDFNTTESGPGETLKFITGVGFDATQPGGDLWFYAPRTGQNWPVFAGRISGADGSISFSGIGGVTSQSERFGLTAQANGLRSTAVGFNAIAGFDDTVAIGTNTNSAFATGISVGSGTTAKGVARSGGIWPTVAIGYFAAAGPPPGNAVIPGSGVSDCIAIGDGSEAGSGGGSNFDCIAIGDGAGAGSYTNDSGTYSDCIAIGDGANAGTNNTGSSDMVAIGDGASSNGSSDCVAIGDGAFAGARYYNHNSVAIGDGPEANTDTPQSFGLSANGVQTVFTTTFTVLPILPDTGLQLTYVIGGVPFNAKATAHGATNTTFNGPHITTGSINFTTGAFSVTFAIAPDSGTVVQVAQTRAFGIAIGTGPRANHNYSICLGANAVSTANRQLVIGGPNAGTALDASITDVYIGSGVQQNNTFNTTAASVVIHASGAAVGAAQNGASIRLAGGLPSSTGQFGGKVGIQNVTPGTMTLADAAFWDRGNTVLAPSGAPLANAASDGLVYIPTFSGPPTGTPTAYAGGVAVGYDVVGDDLYVFNGSWKKAHFA